MKYGTAKWIFILGTASSLALFLVLTVDTTNQVEALSHADKLDDTVYAGKRVFEKYNCNDCHTILGFGAYYAPDLTRVYWRRGAEGIRQVVKHPEIVFKNSFRHMPQQNLSDQEIDQLVAFFKWISEIDNHEWPPQDNGAKPGSAETRRLIGGQGLSEGAALFKAKGCIGCHTINGAGGNIGPVLDHVGSRRDAANIAAFIVDPTASKPDAAMPAQNLTHEEAEAVAEFLAKQK